MGIMSLRLPKSLHEQAKKVAREEEISINQLAVTALAEKMAALMTDDYLRSRAGKGERKKYDAVLRKVRRNRRPPIPGDELDD